VVPVKPGRPDETRDAICGVLQVLQSASGYRFGMEAVFLCGFVRGRARRAVDLGTGSGVIPLMLARFGKADSVVGVEIQAQMADRARRSVLDNRLQSRIEILAADVRRLEGLLPRAAFDLVTANPPYGRAGAGKTPAGRERALARQEAHGTLEDFVSAAAWLLRPGGRLCLVFPPPRLPEALRHAEAHGLRPTRLRLIQGRVGLKPKNCLLESIRGGRAALSVEAPLIVEGPDGKTTPEAEAWLYPEGRG
jgi:tRNA1Val (adenine37-N6)-methyltransferase